MDTTGCTTCRAWFFPARGFGPDGLETASRAYEENGQLVCETVIECEGRTAQAQAQARREGTGRA